MRDFFIDTFNYFSRRKTLLISILIAVFIGFSYLASRINVEEDIMSIMPQSKENERVQFVLQNLNSSDKIILTISHADTTMQNAPEHLMECAEMIADSLSKLTSEGMIKEVFYQADPTAVLDVMKFLYANLPYYMEQDDYQRIDTLLSREKIANALAENRKKLTSPMGMIYRDALLNDPLHLSSSILQELQGFQVESNYTLHDGYIFTQDGKSLLMFITPVYPSSETARNKTMVDQLDDLLSQIGATRESVRISYFGSVAVAVANATQIKTDSLLSIMIAVILILLVLASYFKNIRTLVMLVLPILFGGVFSLGMIYLIKGTISAIALGTGSIILGIAIDYSLHFFIHLHEEPSIKKTIRDISFPLIVGSTTTVGAFLSLIFLKSQLLEDFGLFASFTLIGTIIFALIFLPHLLSQKKRYKQKTDKETIWNKIAGYSLENNNLVVFVILVLTIIFSFHADDVKFEDNMNKINYMTKSQREAFAEISKMTTLSHQMTYFVNEAETMEDALIAYEQHVPTLDSLQRAGIIVSKNSIGNLLPSAERQQQKIMIWNTFWQGKKEDTKRHIVEEGTKAGFNPDAFLNFTNMLDEDFQVQPLHYFDPVTTVLLADFLIHKTDKSAVVSMLYSEPSKAKEIENALSGQDDSFCFDMSTLTKSMLKELSSEFNYILWICGIIVLVFLFFSFGRVEITLVAFLPMMVAFIWILGIMAIFDIRFNIVNIILATFIFGIGDDYSIFIMEGLLHEYTYGKKMLKTYKTAVILSAITMLVGIGSLIFAKHPAMFSLAQVTIIGMLSVALISYTVSPYIFKLITTKKGKRRLIPVTLWNLTKSILSFVIFLIGSIILTLIGFFWITLCGKTEKHKYHFHICLWAIMRGLCKAMIQVPFKIINHSNENFEKPSIIISNHQSHLDLLYVLALSPKIIVLTNKWVWNSPFYGWILRYADFIPVADGIEENLPRLEELSNQGYSILVFPEGTRSADSSILRFHKGAFYLARKLNLDIIPIIIHGIGNILPKTEFMLRKGRVTVKILNRIPPHASGYRNFEELYTEAKAFRELYKEEYEKMIRELETPDYFRDLVFHNYIYKGVGIEREARRLLRKNNAFADLIALLPDEGSVLVKECGTGIFTLMAALVKKNLQITGTDEDKSNIEIANHCISKPDNLTYSEEVAETANFEYVYRLEEKAGSIALEKCFV